MGRKATASGETTPVRKFYDRSTRDDVLSEEHALISRLRPNEIRFLQPYTVRRPSDGDPVGGCYDTIGLALSGGGIRSAAFSTGVLQGLDVHKVLPKIDYLSTVSGGGYTAAAMSVSLARNGGEFPFSSLRHDEKTDSASMQQLRKNANYLKFGNPLEMLYNFAIYARGLFANIFFVLPVLLALAATTLLINPDYDSLKTSVLQSALSTSNGYVPKIDFLLSNLIAIAIVISYCVWSVYQARSKKGEFASPFFKVGGLAIVALACVAFIEWQPVIVRNMFYFPTKEPQNFQASTLGYLLNNLPTFITPLLAVATFAANYLGENLRAGEQGSGKRAWARKIISRIVIVAAGLALPALLWLTYLMLVAWGIDKPMSPYDARVNVPQTINFMRDHLGTSRTYGGVNPFAITYFVFAALMALLWPFLTPNGNSLHRLYRDRLSNAFCFFMDSDGKLQQADDIKLSELQQRRPFHLVNAALNIQNAPEVNQKGRNADFFVFSPLYTGSESTGYVKTENLEEPKSPLGGRGIDFATAIAISGAAASTNMGTYSTRLFSLTLALLNVRLGYWFPNPRQLGMPLRGLKHNIHSVYCFIAEAFGRLNVDHGMVYLTDGGHIENLGIYELLRRRCQVIVAVDAEADKEMSFAALIKLQRYARIDLGIRISLPWNEIRKTARQMHKDDHDALPGPHCAVGRIEYDRGGTGVLLYIKASVTGDENDYIRDYKRRHAEFPHQTTGDQFFSEEQFEVYRALGYHISNGLLQGDQLLQTSNGELESLRDANAKGFGIRLLADILGVPPLPQALLPKKLSGANGSAMPPEKRPRPQPVAA